MPWWHTVVNFQVKMSRFWAAIQVNRPNRGSTSAKQAVFLPRRFPMRYARLGPSSVLVCVLIVEDIEAEAKRLGVPYHFVIP